MDDPRSNQEPPGDAQSSPRRPDLKLATGSRDMQAEHRANQYDALDSTELEGSALPRYLRALYKRRWTAATVFVVVGLVGVVDTFRTKPVYEARVRVLVEAERLNLVKIEDVVIETQTSETQQAILQSRWLASKTLESRGMLGRTVPPRGASTAPATASRSRWAPIVDPVRRLLGWRPSSSTPAEVPEREIEARQIDAFLGGLTVTPSKSVFEIRYRASDPNYAADMANAHAQEYIEQNLELRFAAVKEVTDWLTARLSEQRQRVNTAEQALQHFREQNGLSAARDLDEPARAELNELGASLTRTTTARLEKESLYNKVQGLRNDLDSLLRVPPFLSDQNIQQLRLEVGRLEQQRAQLADKLQERHPDMVKLRAAIQDAQGKLQAEVDRVIDSIRSDVTSARTAETNLQRLLDDQKRDATAQNRKSVEAGILEREVESNRQIYDMLLQRSRETSIAKEIKPTDIRILDPADVPRAPVAPDHTRDIMQSLLLGVALAMALVVGFEHVDNRIKLPVEIKLHLDLPFLGLVPEVRRRKRDQGTLLMTNSALRAPFIEAVRSLRTNLMFSLPDEGMRVVVVTSANPGEGKTVVASNLAIALAQSGARVLLLDTDLRRPCAHTLFGQPREPGLSNLLVGAASAGDVVRRTTVPNLWVLAAGHETPNPPDLLGSATFKKFLKALEQYFEWVIVDAAPVLPVTDSCVVAAEARGVVFVVGSGRVSRAAARRAVQQLDNVGAHIVGAVLNRADLDRNAYYYRYAGYYSRKYNDYYVRAASS